MATREYSKVLLTIWNDPDFRARTVDGQMLYFLLLTHPTLSACGVAEWRESKLVRLAADWTIPRLRRAAWDCAEANLIAVDPETEEALVRSFVRHDGVLKSPNMTKKLVREYGAIASPMLMELVSREVRRAFDEHPDWKGRGIADPVTKQFRNPSGNPLGNPFDLVPKWFQNGSDLVGGSEGGTLSNQFDLSSPIPQPSTNTSYEVLSPSPHGDSDAMQVASRRRPEVPLPSSWAPTQKHFEFAREHHLDIATEVDAFRNHAETHDRRARNWDAAFRTWLTKARPKLAAVSTDQPSPWDRQWKRGPDD